MKILITGIAGFLGSNLAARLLDEGHKVLGNDNLMGGKLENVPKDATVLTSDCCDFEAMKALCKGVDVVIHCAATAHEGLSVFSPAFITKNNYQASVTTMTAAIAANVKRFVFCSSMARYGSNEAPFTEDMECKPQDPYAIAKVASEQTLKLLAETHGIEWNIAIPHNIVGPRQNYTDPFRNVMSIMLNRNLRGQPAYIYGDGSQVRCFSYVDDCVDGLVKLALDKNIKYETVNLGPDTGEVTIKELADLCANETGFNQPPEYLPPRPKEVHTAICSSNKAREILDYKETIDLKDMITKTADWIREAGPKEFDYDITLEINNDLTPKTWSEKLM